MVRRLTNGTWKQYLDFFTFRCPKDEWTFDVGGVPVRVLNDWYAGMQIVARDSILAQNGKMFSVDMKRAFLSVSIVDAAGRERKVEVFVKALHWVFIRVAIDGELLGPEYV